MSNIANSPVGPPELQVPPYDGGRAVFVIPAAWPEQNRRRFELMRARRHRSLSEEEQVEYDSLQALADAVVDSLEPPLMLTPAERAYVDSKAGH